MADKTPSFGERVFDVFVPAIVLVGVLVVVLAVCTWVAAMCISSIDCEIDPTSKRCEIVQAQDRDEAAGMLGL